MANVNIKKDGELYYGVTDGTGKIVTHGGIVISNKKKLDLVSALGTRGHNVIADSLATVDKDIFDADTEFHPGMQVRTILPFSPTMFPTGGVDNEFISCGWFTEDGQYQEKYFRPCNLIKIEEEKDAADDEKKPAK